MGPSDPTEKQRGPRVSGDEWEERRKALEKKMRDELTLEEKLATKGVRGRPSARGQGLVEGYDNAAPRRKSAGERDSTAMESVLPVTHHGDSSPSAGVAATLDYAPGGTSAETRLSSHWVPRLG